MSPRRRVEDSAGAALQRLVNIVSHRSGRVVAIMSEASVTLPQVLLLSRVAAVGSTSPSDIAAEAQASAPAASQMIERLVKQGLLRRIEDRRDRRRKVISLSPAARSLLGRLEAARASDYAMGLAPLGAEMKSAMAALLRQAADELEGAQAHRPLRPRRQPREASR
jgi:DNA-binding MarR family transcriptional regulator